MKLLVIEDNDIKFGLIASFVRDDFPKAETVRASSYQSGIEVLVGNKFDFVILDMTLPVYDAAQSIISMDPLTFGGELIIRECLRRQIAARFVVLTQYDVFVRHHKEVTFGELRSELLEKHPGAVLGCLRLESNSVAWREELAHIMRIFYESSDC